MTPAQQQILSYIAQNETGRYGDDAYRVIFGGHKFTSYEGHPRIKVPIPGRSHWYSTAAGRYQMLSGIWDAQAERLGLKDFSPASQDAAAWDLASRTYASHTGRSLEGDWSKGGARGVDWRGLAPVWTSIPGGAQAPPSRAAPSPQSPSIVTAPPVLTNPPEMEDLLKPPKPSLGSSGPPPSQVEPGGPADLSAMMMLFPQHRFVPITYDPWKETPHLEPVEYDPFAPPGGTEGNAPGSTKP